MPRARLGGWLAVGVSVALLGVVLVRHVGLNVFNGWTIGAGSAGGLIGGARRETAALRAAFGLVLVAMLPALFGGLGLLYLPSVVLLSLDAVRPAVLG